ncbi:MAG: hypothetical protein ABWZ66_04740 [Pyrinomonadaceae bacterium]
MQEQWLNNALQRLNSNGYKISANVNYQGKTFWAVAHKSGLSMSKFGNSEIFFVFVEIPNLDYQSLRQFSDFAFNYAIASKSFPLPCGFFEHVSCFPVAVTENIDAATAQAVSGETPPKHWAANEMPVVYSRSQRMLHYFQGTPLWGAAYFNGYRRTILEFLQPN